jgi:hypothetical protein
VYDVMYRNQRQGEKLLARGLAREQACELARAEARRRHVGRMFAAGSELGSPAEMILIVESRRTA